MWKAIAIACALVTAPAAAAEQSIAILSIAGEPGDAALRQSLADALASELGKVPGLRVITKSELDSLLGFEKLKDAMGCDDVSCLAEIGAALGTDRLMTGTLATGRASGGSEFFSLTLQLVDPKSSNVAARLSETWEGGAPGLFSLLPALTLRLLYGEQAKSFRGSVLVSSSVEGAAVFVDGKQVGVTPLFQPVALPIGKAKIEVTAEDFEPFAALVVINRDETTGLVANLKELPSDPLYTRWWFWGGVGLAVAGGTTAAIMATRDGGLFGGDGNNSMSTGSGTISVPPVPGFALTGGRR